MKTTDYKIRPIIKICNTQKGYAILKYLNRFGESKYTELGNIIGSCDKNGRVSITAYYVRQLVKYNVIEKYHGMYRITKHGKKVLKLLSGVNEKFVTENQDEICENSYGECEHEWVRICRNCSQLIKQDPIIEGQN